MTWFTLMYQLVRLSTPQAQRPCCMSRRPVLRCTKFPKHTNRNENKIKSPLFFLGFWVKGSLLLTLQSTHCLFHPGRTSHVSLRLPVCTVCTFPCPCPPHVAQCIGIALLGSPNSQAHVLRCANTRMLLYPPTKPWHPKPFFSQCMPHATVCACVPPTP